MGLKADIIFEWLSNHLPFGNGKAHTMFLEKVLDGNIKTALDLGCGRGTYKVFNKFYSVGIDVFPENIQIANVKGNYKKLIEGDIGDVKFSDRLFDAVACIDVIEHMSKEDGVRLLENMERMAKEKVVVITSWGYQSIPKRYDNPYLNHQCGWQPEEFIERGYYIYPFKSLRWNYGNHPILLVLSYGLSIILRPLIIAHPEKYCNDFAAVKELK
jgi:SAM-dependent methyltransferase